MANRALGIDPLLKRSSGSRSDLTLQRLAILSIAMVYALVLVYLPLHMFKDRTAYIGYYAPYSDQIFQCWAEQGLLHLLANEPGWLLLNIALSSALQPEDVVRVFIFVPSLAVAWATLRSNPKHIFWLFLILFYPAVIKNHVVHIRQGLAIAIFQVGLLATGHRGLRWMLISLTPFVHSSFFFVTIIMLLAYLLRSLRFSVGLSILVFVLATAALLISMEWIASALGARQAEEYELLGGTAVSGINFLFWAMILGVMVMEGKDYLNRYQCEVAAVIFYLSTYFFTPIAARVFESLLLLVLIAGVSLTQWRRVVFKSAIVLFGMAFWITRGMSSMTSE